MANMLEILGFGRREPVTREARASDAARLAELHADAFRIGWDESEFDRLLANRLSRCFVATEGPEGAVSGFILLSGVPPESEVLSVTVARSVRGRGIGRKLMAAALGRLVAEGMKTIFLEVEETNAAAVNLYRNIGFHEIGRRENYYRSTDGKPVAALTMRLDLD